MISTSHPIFASATHSDCDAENSVSTFNWLLVLGFPVDIAAAKAMPAIFSDAEAPTSITDGIRVFAVEAA